MASASALAVLSDIVFLMTNLNVFSEFLLTNDAIVSLSCCSTIGTETSTHCGSGSSLPS